MVPTKYLLHLSWVQGINYPLLLSPGCVFGCVGCRGGLIVPGVSSDAVDRPDGLSSRLRVVVPAGAT